MHENWKKSVTLHTFYLEGCFRTWLYKAMCLWNWGKSKPKKRKKCNTILCRVQSDALLPWIIPPSQRCRQALIHCPTPITALLHPTASSCPVCSHTPTSAQGQPAPASLGFRWWLSGTPLQKPCTSGKMGLRPALSQGSGSSADAEHTDIGGMTTPCPFLLSRLYTQHGIWTHNPKIRNTGCTNGASHMAPNTKHFMYTYYLLVLA